ncbi:MAG: metal-dependent hydrolase [Candidatus Methylumidiphilus sp.]
MANFKTHLAVAAGASGVAALACMKAGVVGFAETPILLGLGTFGGLLPDIDSDHSVPIRISFNLLALTLAFLVMFAFASRYSVVELAALWLGVLFGVRYLVLECFVRFTSHRGAIHSVLAAVFFALSTVSLSRHLFAQPYPISWLYGTFVGGGFIVHLVLDEVFSVDLLNRRIKSSFGSALKLVSLKFWRATLLLLMATAGVYSTVSYPSGFYAGVWDKLASHYSDRSPWLMPGNGQWFKGLLGRSFCQP